MTPKKLRIMFLASHLTNSSGGTKFVFLLAKELSKKHELTLFLQKPPTFFKNELEDANINVKVLSNCSTGDLKFWLTFSSQIKSQIKYLKNESKKFDVVISIIFPMNIIANSINLPHVQHCFQPFAFFWDPILISKLPLSQRIFLGIMKILYGKLDIEYTKKSNIISTPTQEVSNYIKEFYGKDSVPTSAGVDSIFKPTPNQILEKKYLGQKILIHSTDWTFTKNTNWLIDQFIEIHKKIKKIFYYVHSFRAFNVIMVNIILLYQFSYIPSFLQYINNYIGKNDTDFILVKIITMTISKELAKS